MAEAGILYSVEHLIEGSIAVAKGIYDPTLPLKATLIPIKDVVLPRAYHSVSEIKGRAYVFGGKQEGEEPADNAMHIIILPSSGIESTDYKKLEPTPSSPPARYGHSTAIIDDQIYVFGGSDTNGPLEEKGRVWVFDTDTNSWSYLDPTNRDVPGARTWASAAASAQPQPEHHRTDENVAPQLPPDPAKMVPEPLSPSTYGSFVIYGGVSGADPKASTEVWAFDIASRTWSQLSSPPITPSTKVHSPSLTFVSNRLYAVSGAETHYLDLDLKSSYTDTGSTGDLGLSPLGPWSKVSSSNDPETSTPNERSAAALIPITTGQGRNYLLLVGGDRNQDIWSLQLKPESRTAASLKDAARHAIKKSTAEQEWAEVRYYNTEGRIVQEGQDGRGIGERKGSAACKVSAMDGGTVLVWGGVEGGKVKGDGLLIEVEK